MNGVMKGLVVMAVLMYIISRWILRRDQLTISSFFYVVWRLRSGWRSKERKGNSMKINVMNKGDKSKVGALIQSGRKKIGG